MDTSATPVRPATLQWGDGTGPKVLLLHGLSSVAGLWWRVGSELAAAGCIVVAPDLRGHGRSPSATSYRFSDHAADLATLGETWDLALGHSLAGPILATLAAGSADSALCLQLLLLDPVFEILDSEFEAVLADQLSVVDPRASADQVGRENPSWHPEDCFHKAVGARGTSSFVIEHCLRDNMPYHHLGLLESLSVPARILRADPTVGAMSTESELDRIDNPMISHVQIDGAGHSIQRERADLVIEHALDLLGLPR